MAKDKDKKILLAHGGGGQMSDELVRNTILAGLGEERPDGLEDSARLRLSSKSISFTTDSYVVKPLFFNGGDIGKLAVCGTVNDLAVAGTRPVALSLSLIIETGLDFAILEKIIDSIARTARENDVHIVTGDTKTVDAGQADKIFINTSGVGVKIKGANPGFKKIRSGDKIILSGTIGDHGMTILSEREGIKFQTKLKSDCAGLAGLTSQLFEKSGGIRFMRDPTRGGLAATLNEISRQTGFCLEIEQSKIPVNPIVQSAADMLGLDVLDIANEGKIVAIVSPECSDKALRICKRHPLGKRAEIFGEIAGAAVWPVVEMRTSIGGRRIVQMPYGRELPRIC
jgi:hydrogenase expression/formation protein HypE